MAAARNGAEFQRDFHHLMGPSEGNPAVSRENVAVFTFTIIGLLGRRPPQESCAAINKE